MSKRLPFPSRESAGSIAALAGIVLAGLLLRLWGIQYESAWWDEYSSLVHLHRGSLWEFLRFNRIYDPATLPLYYSIEYWWYSLFGANLWWMRIPSVILGIALISAVYALGAESLGRRAGLVAATCVAFSPIHIFHSQGIRMYVLFTLLAVLSMYTYLLARKHSRPALLGSHLLTQLLLSWTHPFAVLVPLVQGLAWLPSARTEWKRIMVWGFASLAAFAPALVYISQIRYWSVESTTDWFPIPNAVGLLADIFADDIVSATYQLRQSPGTWDWIPAISSVLPSLRPILDTVFVSGIACALAVSLWMLRKAGPKHRDQMILFWVWLVIPVVALYIGSLLSRPMIFPRYTVHSSIALYLLLAFTTRAIAIPALRAGAELSLAVLLLFQVSLTHPGPQRTDYIGVAKKIQNEANSVTDLVIVQSELWGEVFRYNASDLAVPVISGESPELCALMSRHYLAALEGKATVWVVVPDDYFDAEPDVEFSTLLERAKLGSIRDRFHSIRDIDLFSVTGSGTLVPDESVRELIASKADSAEARATRRALAGVAASVAVQGNAGAALELLSAYFGAGADEDYLFGVVAESIANHPDSSLDALRMAVETSDVLGLLDTGQSELAEQELVRLSTNPLAPSLIPVQLLDLVLDSSTPEEDLLHAVATAANRPRMFYFHLLDALMTSDSNSATPALVETLGGLLVRELSSSPPQQAYFHLIQALTERSQQTPTSVIQNKLLQALEAGLSTAEGYPRDLLFHLSNAIRFATQDDPDQLPGFVKMTATVLERSDVVPDDTYFHLSGAALFLAEHRGCSNELTRLLRLAAPYQPLTFKTFLGPMLRRCEEGGDITCLLESRARLNAGMEAFAKGEFLEAAEKFREAQCDNYGMPLFAEGLSLAMVGDLSGFHQRIQQAIETDPGIAEVYGVWFEAVSNRDRESALAAAEIFRGSDLDNADLLVGIINEVFEAPSIPTQSIPESAS